MNKQGLIERIESLKNIFGNKNEYIKIDMVVELISELDEPKKVTIPQFVAEHIEWTKEEDFHLLGAMNRENFDKKLEDWFYTDDNMELFARAWLDGYEVEKKRYLVKVKGVNDYGCYLNKGLLSKEYFWESKAEIGGCRTKHTHKQLEEDGFGWVFDCEGIEIEEVE